MAATGAAEARADARLLRELSALLREAQGLPAAERARWLEALPQAQQALRPQLEPLLARLAGADAEGDEAPAEGAAARPRTTGPSGASPLDLEPPRPDGAAGFRPGQAVGPYRLIRPLGSGGMGAVWLAMRADGTLTRQVALKLPHPLFARRLVQRFAQECEILATLEHPNIARLYDAGVDAGGLPYLALEYVQGEPIDQWAAARQLNLRQRLTLLLQVAHAVSHAHSRLVVHRDLKPGNILVTAEGQVRLLDFGIAKLLDTEGDDAAHETATRGRAMTPDYASPEQVAGRPIGTASDLYSLGVVAYELLCGQRPYRLKRGHAAELEAAIVSASVRPASEQAADPAMRRALQGDLDAILAQAMHQDEARRYSSAEAFAADLRRHLTGEPVLARPPTLRYRLGRFAMRWRLPLAIGSITGAALVVTSGMAWWQAAQARAALDRAQAMQGAAQREARRAQAVQAFLLDIFRANTSQQPDPQAAQRTTARDLLDIGAARIGQALQDAPEERYQVLGTLAQLYNELGLATRAATLRQQQLEVARTHMAADDPRRADAALALMIHHYDGSGRPQARALLDEARAVVAAAGERAGATRGHLLLWGARYHRYGSLKAWRDDAQAAVAFYKAQAGDDPALLRALLQLGSAQVAAGDLMAGLSILDELRERALARRHDARAALVVPTVDLADVQAQLGQFQDALGTLREGVEASSHIHGRDHRVTLVTRIHLANRLLLQGQREAGLAEHSAVRAAIAAMQPAAEGWWRVHADYLLARALLQIGEPKAGLPVFAHAADEIRRELPDSGTRVFRVRWLGEILIALGRCEEAVPLIDEAAQAWARYADGALQPWSSNELRLSQARLAIGLGQADRAFERLQQVHPTPEADARFVDLQQMRRDLLLAEAWMLQGEPGRAETAARKALAAVSRVQGPAPLLEAEAWQALGRAAHASGQSATALQALAKAVALREGAEGEHGLGLAQARLAWAEALPVAAAQRRRLLTAAAAAYRSQGAQPPAWGQRLIGG